MGSATCFSSAWTPLFMCAGCGVSPQLTALPDWPSSSAARGGLLPVGRAAALSHSSPSSDTAHPAPASPRSVPVLPTPRLEVHWIRAHRGRSKSSESPHAARTAGRETPATSVALKSARPLSLGSHAASTASDPERETPAPLGTKRDAAGRTPRGASACSVFYGP